MPALVGRLLGEGVYYLEARVRGRTTRWPLPAGPLLVGRGESCDVVIDDDSISRRHLKLEIGAERVAVEDLGSTNGLRVGGEVVEEASLEFDRWFVAGAVMLAVRRGVSLTPDISPARHTPVQARRDADSTLTEGPRTRPADQGEGDALQRLIARLRDVREPEQVLEELLDHLCESEGFEGAMLIEDPSGVEDLAIRYLARRAPGQDLQKVIESCVLDPRRDGAREGQPFVACPVYGEGAERGWLVAYPLSPGREPSPLMRFSAAIAGRWLDGGVEAPRGTAAAEDPSPRATTSAQEPVLVGVSLALRVMLDEVDRLARTELPLLVQGESGTGKELVARRLHARSQRGAGPFFAINCSALPRELLEAELFGIERGVATGVEPRPGRFALASGGTLLLDEVGDLPLELQPKLLRALESSEILPLGAPTPIAVDVRIVAATHQDLEAMVDEGRFRRDLYHRIAGAVITVPPLRERPEDIIPLAREFAKRIAKAGGLPGYGLDLATARVLLGHTWPGNVRELQHVMARACALAEDAMLHPALLPPALAEGADEARADAYLGLREDFRTARRGFERLYFAQLLERCRGNLSEAARRAELTRGHLYKKLEELGLR